jgi:hypothetical protein
MTHTDTRVFDSPPLTPVLPAVADGDGPDGDGPGGPNVADDAGDPRSPWHGIPAALLDGAHSYDKDSAGGCG